MKPHIYYVTFGPLSTDPVRNVVIVCECSLFVALLLSRVAGVALRVLVTFVFVLGPAGGDMTPLSSLCPTSRCKDLLQSLPRTLQLHLSYTALCSWSSVKSEVLKGPYGIFLSVDLSSEAGNHHRKEMKGLLEYWMNTLPRIVCIVHILSAYFWPFDRLPFSCQYQFNTSDSGRVRHKGFCFTHPIIRTKMEL